MDCESILCYVARVREEKSAREAEMEYSTTRSTAQTPSQT